MSKSWKLKTNSSNILLVLIILIHIKAEWVGGKKNQSWEYNIADGDNYHIPGNNLDDGIQIYVGHDEIAQFFFNSTKNNNFLILLNINKCLENFNFVTCLKLLLLENINSFKVILNKLNDERKDVSLLSGLLTFKMKSDVDNINVGKGSSDDDDDDDINDLDLDDEISNKIVTIFQKRLLRVNINSKVKMDITPVLKNDGTEKNICFTYKFLEEPESVHSDVAEGRKKKNGFPMMMLPQILMLGFLPFTLASLKSMVMNAVIINMMALNGAVFMLIRDIVFGTRPNSNLQYVNYGYSKDRQKQRKRPILIIHSSAAFVKQPKVHYSEKTKGSHHFHEANNYFENFDAFHHNYKHTFGEKNDFGRPIFHGSHDKKNQSKFLEKHGANGFNNMTAAAYQHANESFIGNSGNKTNIKKTNIYIQDSFNNHEFNKINSNNYYANINNSYFARPNQRTLSSKTNINNHLNYETKPKFRYSSKIHLLPAMPGRNHRSLNVKAKAAS